MLEAYAKNEGLWSDYKDQLVSTVLWENRFAKHLPKCPVTFNKYSRMKVRSDPKFSEPTLTDNLTSAALPSCFQDPYAEKRRNVLSNTRFGEKLMPPSEFENKLASALVHPAGGGRLKMEKAIPGLKTYDGPTGKSIRDGAQPIRTIAGTITQTFLKERRRSPDPLADSGEPRRRTLPKYVGPDVRDTPPRKQAPLRRPKSNTSAWRYGASPERSSPFSEPCKPAPTWGQRPERWVLAPKARAEPAWESAASRPDSPSRVWVPSGPSSGYHKHVLEAERESGEGHAAEFHARPETAAAIRRSAQDDLHKAAVRPKSSRPWTPTANALKKGGAFADPTCRHAFTGRW